MIKSTRLFGAALLGSTAMLIACSPASSQAGGKSFIDANKASNAIVGEFRVPEGLDVTKAKIIACEEPFQECEGREIKVKAVRLSDSPQAGWGYDDRDGGFVFKGLNPAKKYQVLAWMDVNNNDDADVGDTLGIMNNAAAVPTGYGERIKMLTQGAFGTTTEVDDKGARGGAPTMLAGTWKSQSGGGSELKMTPTVKFQPSIATGNGLDMGGTFGAGSQTNTVIVNEYKSVKGSDRAQSLTINPDGSFKWIVDRGAPRGKSCVEQVHEERLGQARINGSKVTLSITGGFSSLTNPCGEPQRNRRSPFPNRSETYNFTRTGNTLNLKDSGGTNWTFKKS
ncbi:hypothetical protein [Allosphingosinicella vermicomposti]|uniref:hypothetical protein n=1 Tax=Allosphingosinicella vermicomposti TaxID=614671 RepID=UPI00131A5978|nr:hypothetical protein [Allosphingosinicella vermicomposti]